MGMHTIGNITWIIIQLLIGYNLVLPLFLYLFYSFHTTPKTHALQISSAPAADYAVIVTAYEQTSMLPAVVASLLRMDHPCFMIYVVADKCDISGLDFDTEKVLVLQPPEILASNTRSHFYAIRHFIRSHNRLTIIDSDNLAERDYLTALDKYFDAGFIAVQGQRKAKNLDTTYACLDAARDIYYHFYDGIVLFNIGSSATLSGSGMAFTVDLYRDCLEHLDVQGAGFDKVLQSAIVTRGHRIAYAPAAVVYDEKTSRPEQLVKQRARWINTWFKYFRFGFSLMAKGVTSFNRNRFLFGLVLLRPPLFIFLLLSVACMLLNIFFNPLAAIIWLFALLIFVAGFVLALVNTPTDKRIYRSLRNIPVFIFYQVLSLLKVRKANRHSVSTQHYHDTNNTQP
jgi:cellulose synthase/poly-beta-1,6-N-acetylglucosamine synthase-like glycosyltransferase